jgi:hypothetical protein
VGEALGNELVRLVVKEVVDTVDRELDAAVVKDGAGRVQLDGRAGRIDDGRLRHGDHERCGRQEGSEELHVGTGAGEATPRHHP